MRKLALLFVLFASPALADDPAKPEAPPAQPAPATEARPASSPTVWVWSDIDTSDINNLTACVQELPKKVADPWFARLQQHIKVVK